MKFYWRYMVLILMIVDKRCGFYQLPFGGKIDISAICGRKNKPLLPDFFDKSQIHQKMAEFLKKYSFCYYNSSFFWEQWLILPVFAFYWETLLSVGIPYLRENLSRFFIIGRFFWSMFHVKLFVKVSLRHICEDSMTERNGYKPYFTILLWAAAFNCFTWNPCFLNIIG
jgi:hypothetical protein